MLVPRLATLAFLTVATLGIFIPNWNAIWDHPQLVNQIQERAKAPDHTWGRDPVRGVNIGGWLVLESWITPSLFAGKEGVIDENTYAQYWAGRDKPWDKIHHHWHTWITEDDFQKIADVGLNTVRIPVGFWSLIPLSPGEAFMPRAFEYLKKAVGWARNANLKVMLDLHGAPGGQNTWDNSGLTGKLGWYDSGTNADRTLAALQVLVAEFNKPEYEGAVTSICVLNEPNPRGDAGRLDFLKNFYERAYGLIRDQSPAQGAEGIVVVLHEAYMGLEYWRDYMPSPRYQRVALDTHIYRVFTDEELAHNFAQHIGKYCDEWDRLMKSNERLWTIVGEFSAAPTRCASGSSKLADGQTYANPNDCEHISKRPGSWTDEYRNYLTQSWETQTFIYEKAAGWVNWTWKTETAMDWSLEAGLDGGWITPPKDLAQNRRKFPGPCGTPVTSGKTSGGTHVAAQAVGEGSSRGPDGRAVAVAIAVGGAALFAF